MESNCKRDGYLLHSPGSIVVYYSIILKYHYNYSIRKDKDVLVKNEKV